MYVRLAFAVAAHMEPDVLLVDEVLAVGDAEFQKKCLGKMQTVVRHGRTVLFVSHNMAAMKALCDRAVLLDAGRVVADGPVDAIVDRYLGTGAAPVAQTVIPDDAVRSGSGEARFRSVELMTIDGRPCGELYFGQRFRIRVTVEVIRPIAAAVAGVVIDALDGTSVASAFSTDRRAPPLALPSGWQVLEVDVDLHLLPRTYAIKLMLNRTDGYDIDVVQRTLDFIVMNVAETGGDSYPWGTVHGYVRAQAAWRGPAPVTPATPESLAVAGPSARQRP
jgi:lipopolysaccharide transport system ATP-binding protein